MSMPFWIGIAILGLALMISLGGSLLADRRQHGNWLWQARSARTYRLPSNSEDGREG